MYEFFVASFYETTMQHIVIEHESKLQPLYVKYSHHYELLEIPMSTSSSTAFIDSLVPGKDSLHPCKIYL